LILPTFFCVSRGGIRSKWLSGAQVGGGGGRLKDHRDRSVEDRWKILWHGFVRSGGTVVDCPFLRGGLADDVAVVALHAGISSRG
jgi:hypothetical protein